METKYIFGIVVISWIGAMELMAMYVGLNGQYFLTAISGIVAVCAGIVGYAVGKKSNGKTTAQDLNTTDTEQ